MQREGEGLMAAPLVMISGGQSAEEAVRSAAEGGREGSASEEGARGQGSKSKVQPCSEV